MGRVYGPMRAILLDD